tara:strand:- start:17003 stop:18097 length:1095 start_codon:yes stop_codon:yes gene_type:complete
MIRILFLAPLPPPITGQSVASRALLDAMKEFYEVNCINFSKNDVYANSRGVSRIIQVIYNIFEVLNKKNQSDLIYITISESIAGNIKDLFIYLICYDKLTKMYIHLHGGTIKRQLWDKYSIIYRINQYFLSKSAGIIVSGKSHEQIFDGIVEPKKISIIPNFANDDLFVNKKMIEEKFSETMSLRIVYISSMKEQKGYMTLLNSFIGLDQTEQSKLRIDFAGYFDDSKSEECFKSKIKKYPSINYHGVISHEQKIALFQEAHVFILPSKFLEGQPISILEAYASGCVVLASSQEGILDIFTHEVNGFVINKEDMEACLISCLRRLINSKSTELKEIALFNHLNATSKYRSINFTNAVMQKMNLI